MSSKDAEPRAQAAAREALRPKREDGCFCLNEQRKYYEVGNCFVKRTLRPLEYLLGYRGWYVPPWNEKRLRNEAACLRYIREHTDIPVPTLYCNFEDDEAYYLVMERVKGVNMKDLEDHQKETVEKELRKHLDTLSRLRSRTIGGPTGLVVPPARVISASPEETWLPKTSATEDYVFCHNDLSAFNILVDPDTLKINAIIDWEYGGFYPNYFEWPFYTRGPTLLHWPEEQWTPRSSLPFYEILERVVPRRRSLAK